jgi:hypothetical protein
MSFSLAALMVAGLSAGQDLTFEPSDTNLLQPPEYSGSTVGFTGGTAADTEQSENAIHNTILNPADGTEGTSAYHTQFALTSDDPATSFIRITDYADRHLLSEPAPSSGIGLYLRYTGTAGSIEVAVTIDELPNNTDDNETYETTTWYGVAPSNGWQYFHWDFATAIINDPVNNWGQAIGYGDGVYDGGGVGDTTSFEAVHFRPIPGVTVAGGSVDVYLDDIHTGAAHNPIYPVITAVGGYELYR